MKRHVNIPIFIPEAACPNRCVYCNQFRITGSLHVPTIEEIHQTIETYLSSIDTEKTVVEIAFFGGNFTGLPLEEQIAYLEAVQPYFEKGIKGIRLSTRPDYINEEKVRLLKEYKVSEVELGIQSSNQKVLELCRRGYDVVEIEKAIDCLKQYEIQFGMQMMVGLPGGNVENEMQTARDIHKWGAVSTRIYPLVPIEDTPLIEMIERNEYHPLSLNEAIQRTKPLMLFFEKHQIQILRMGLHSFDNIASTCEPFHPAFGQLVRSRVWADIFNSILHAEIKQAPSSIQIKVNNAEKVYAIGYQASNLKILKQHFKKVYFIIDNDLKGRNYHVDID
ncbi:MAG: radical SAM protein [Bacteroidota bacterium]